MPTLTSFAKPEVSSAMSRKYSLVIFLLLAPVILASVSLSPDIGSALAGRVGKVAAGESRKARAPEAARADETYGRLPLRFEVNHGQTAREVNSISRGSGYTLFLTLAGAVLRLSGSGEKPETGSLPSSQLVRTASTFRIGMAGSHPRPRVVGETELPGRSNYLIGTEREWVTNVANFEKVKYESVYPGIDVVYYGNQGRLEYDFLVAPHADPHRIQLRFDGAQCVRVDEQGELVISTKSGEVRQQKPLAYQEAVAGGARAEVPARYRVRRDGRVNIEVGNYDRPRPLVIDPVLIYSTYLGGGGSDQGQGLAIGADGSAYVTGSTGSIDFPGPSPIQGGRGAFSDAFVLKLNRLATRLFMRPTSAATATKPPTPSPLIRQAAPTSPVGQVPTISRALRPPSRIRRPTRPDVARRAT